jgi:hypothetical protein
MSKAVNWALIARLRSLASALCAVRSRPRSAM